MKKASKEVFKGSLQRASVLFLFEELSALEEDEEVFTLEEGFQDRSFVFSF